MHDSEPTTPEPAPLPLGRRFVTHGIVAVVAFILVSVFIGRQLDNVYGGRYEAMVARNFAGLARHKKDAGQPVIITQAEIRKHTFVTVKVDLDPDTGIGTITVVTASYTVVVDQDGRAIVMPETDGIPWDWIALGVAIVMIGFAISSLVSLIRWLIRRFQERQPRSFATAIETTRSHEIR